MGLETNQQASWLDLARDHGGKRDPASFGMSDCRRLCRPLVQAFRIATAVAPIAAVVGEWVGSGAGLGYLMLHANGRGQTALMFAAMVVLMAIALCLYLAVDRLLIRLTPWAPHSLATSNGRNT